MNQAFLAEQLAITRNLSTLAAEEFVRVWRTIDPADVKSGYEKLAAALRDIAAAYGEVAAVAAADAYDEMAQAARFVAKPAVPAAAEPPAEQLAAMLRWGLGPLWGDTPRPATAMQNLAGAASRLSLQPGRVTTYGMARRDRVRVARVPQGKTCPYCLMLASRGADYVTDTSAGYGRQFSRSGKEFVGEGTAKFHSNCDCIVVTVHTPDDLPDINREMEAQWAAMKAQGGGTLQDWRSFIKDGTIPDRATVPDRATKLSRAYKSKSKTAFKKSTPGQPQSRAMMQFEAGRLSGRIRTLEGKVERGSATNADLVNLDDLRDQLASLRGGAL